MSQSGRFRLDWFAGASTQVDLYSPGKDSKYSFRYSPSFRSTIRAVRHQDLGTDQFERIQRQLTTLVHAVRNSLEPLAAAQDIGIDLLQWYLPEPIQDEFGQQRLFIELGLDHSLVQFPWELMYDGDKYLCLKHDIGRFINTGDTFIPKSSRISRWFSEEYDHLDVLIISVPEPLVRSGGTTYRALPEVRKETDALTQLLGDKAEINLTVLRDKEATWKAVRTAVSSGRYDIVHYNGHAYSGRVGGAGSSSGLVLYDLDMTSETITKAFGKKPPILLFMNACETGTFQANFATERGVDFAGLGNAFLLTGAYVIGNAWPVSDRGAEVFARQFYSSLLGALVDKPTGRNRPLGQAIREARTKCKTTLSPDDLAWASYVLYGDPRLGFKLTARGEKDDIDRVVLDLLHGAITGPGPAGQTSVSPPKGTE